MSNNLFEDRLLNAKEAATYLGLAEGTVRNKANSGDIPHIRLGRTLKAALRFRKSELDQWVASQRALTTTESVA